ncbi:MAG: carbohydrate ABC transporter permease [Dictyoglomus sp.]|nr:carbohydrate ABC transporter permease [Dictyoglomus sp.]MDW8188236.1 carbohydrate ABC transporter permease [Dictyoglomus sp.]
MKEKINRSIWGNLIVSFVLIVVAIFMALPLVYSIMNAFKPLDELFLFPPRLFVRKPTFKNFSDLFYLMSTSFVPFSRYIFNSIFISFFGTLGHVLIASMAAYPLAKHRFPGSKILFNLVIFSLMFSGYVTNIPRFIIMSKLHLLDSYLSLILPYIGATLGLFLMKQFMEQIPDSYIESARIDGANEFKIWWYVIMPNVKPAWLTLILFSFREIWNDTYTPALYIHNEALKPFSLALTYIQQGGFVRAGAGAAAAVLMLIPSILIFLITQSNVMETMKSAGIKG